MIPHTRTILTSTAADENDGVLLDVVALAGNVRGNHTTAGQTHTGRLALARIGLLGAGDADFEAHAFLLRAYRIGKGRGDGVACALRFTTSLS